MYCRVTEYSTGERTPDGLSSEDLELETVFHKSEPALTEPLWNRRQQSTVSTEGRNYLSADRISTPPASTELTDGDSD